MNPLQASWNFVVNELNMKHSKAYQSIFLSPFSFEDPFTFGMSLPGLFYISFLIESKVGSRVFGGLLLANCAVAAISTIIWHWYIGYLEVRKRGKMSNHNGNAVLFMSSLYATLNAGANLYVGKSIFTSFPVFILPLLYSVLYFSSYGTMNAKNYNETHVVGLLFGAMLGSLLKMKF